MHALFSQYYDSMDEITDCHNNH